MFDLIIFIHILSNGLWIGALAVVLLTTHQAFNNGLDDLAFNLSLLKKNATFLSVLAAVSLLSGLAAAIMTGGPKYLGTPFISIGFLLLFVAAGLQDGLLRKATREMLDFAKENNASGVESLKTKFLIGAGGAFICLLIAFFVMTFRNMIG